MTNKELLKRIERLERLILFLHQTKLQKEAGFLNGLSAMRDYHGIIDDVVDNEIGVKLDDKG